MGGRALGRRRSVRRSVGRGAPWRLAAGCLPLALLAVTGPSMAARAAALRGTPETRAGAAKSAVNLVAERRAAVARAAARVSAAGRVLTGLETRAEVLTERYDQSEWAEQQASAAYDVSVTRLTAALRTQRAANARLAAQADSDMVAGGDQGTQVLMLGGAGGPTAYFNAVGLSEVLAEQRVDLVEASQAAGTVTTLFREQAGELLAQRRTDLATAARLRRAIEAAVGVQLATVRVDETRSGQALAALARAEKAAAALDGGARAGAATAGGPAGGLGSGPASGPADGALDGPAGGQGGVAASAGLPSSWAPDAGASAQQGVTAADWALTQLGKPYQWGGAGPATYDCSGLTMDAWARAGVKLGHWTGYQWVSGPHVPLSQLRPGDLVFYATNVARPATIHHVGIYIGAGLMVDAPYTGADVRIDSVHQYTGLIGATRPAAQ
jgi:cell wall-associated NlpC family hydrolase